jgi:hypothetical protein
MDVLRTLHNKMMHQILVKNNPEKLISWTCRTYEELKYSYMYKILLGKISDTKTCNKKRRGKGIIKADLK